MGKVTGFLEFERDDRDYEPVEERISIGANSSCRCRRRRTASRRRAAWIAACPIATPAVRSTTRSRTGTTSSIAATGRKPRATCTRPTISRKSPAASARRRARPPARSTSTTIRSPSRRSNARSSTAPSSRAGSSRSRPRSRPARKSRSSARVRPGWPARSSSRAPATTCTSSRSTPRPAACCATAFPTSRWRSTIVDRRVAQMEAEGVTFHYGVHVGVNLPVEELLARLRRGGARGRRREGARPADPGPRARRHPFRHGFPAAAEPPRQRRAAGRQRADPRRRQARRRHRRRRHRLRLHRHLDPPGRAVGHQFRDHAAAARAREQAADLAGLAAEAAHLVEPRGRRRARLRGADHEVHRRERRR